MGTESGSGIGSVVLGSGLVVGAVLLGTGVGVTVVVVGSRSEGELGPKSGAVLITMTTVWTANVVGPLGGTCTAAAPGDADGLSACLTSTRASSTRWAP